MFLSFNVGKIVNYATETQIILDIMYLLRDFFFTANNRHGKSSVPGLSVYFMNNRVAISVVPERVPTQVVHKRATRENIL